MLVFPILRSIFDETMNTTVLILTHMGEMGLPLAPHIKHLKESNPGVEVCIIVGKDSPFGKGYNWKNGDQPLRKWWKENGREVITPIIHVIEWDTLVTGTLPELPEYLDLAGRELMLPGVSNRWVWFQETNKMQLRKGESPCGLVSFGCFVMRREVLDAVCKTRWDAVYEDSIQNELRFPTAAKAEGYRVGEVFLPFVRWTEYPVGSIPGVYHAVKHPWHEVEGAGSKSILFSSKPFTHLSDA